MKAPIDWLLEGEPWVEYVARRDLLGQDENSPRVGAARRAMLADPMVKGLIAELSGWPGTVISSHKSPGQPFHKLTFIADLGLVSGDPRMTEVVSRILANRSPEGPFLLPVPASTSGKESGQGKWAWALCDAPLIVYALVRFGLAHDPAVEQAVNYLAGLSFDAGWPCAVSKELGNFRGPGRKGEPCPYATLVMLKLLSQLDRFRDSSGCHRGAESLLSLWAHSRNRHPFMFYMGTDFRKLKAPFIWYDLLHVLDVLSRFPWLGDDPRLEDAISVLESKADPEGRFTIESVGTAWNNWEFGQKRVPSRWLTLLAWRVLNRFRE